MRTEDMFPTKVVWVDDGEGHRIYMPETPDDVVCDFCAEKKPMWTYRVRDFEYHDAGSVGDWAVCDYCHGLIQQDRWEALRERVLDHIAAVHPAVGLPEDRVVLAKSMDGWLEMFKSHQAGIPTRDGGE